MKLKKILGVAALAIGIMSLPTAVFADENYFVMSTPFYDLTTNEETEDLVAGHKIAVPVDVTSTTGGLTSFSICAEFDPDYVEAGLVLTDCTTEEKANIKNFAGGTTTMFKDHHGKYVAYINTYQLDDFGDKEYIGDTGGNTDWGFDLDRNLTFFFSAYEISFPYTEEPECYVLFTVKKTVSADELNVTPWEPVYDYCQLGDNRQGLPSVNSVAGEADKINACYGAFKINLNTATLTKWVQGLQVSINGGDKKVVDEYVTTDNVNYSFPVRITSNSGKAETATVAVYADVSNSETDTTNKTNVKIGEFTVDLDTPTAYDGQSLNY